jgi:geranylgeranyl pyrophosphate synthase
MNTNDSFVFDIYQNIINSVDPHNINLSNSKYQFHFDYSEAEGIGEYFRKNIIPTLDTLFNHSEFLNYSLELYPRRQLFVFTDIFYKKISGKTDSFLSAILYAIWSYLLWIDDIIDNGEKREEKRSMTFFSKQIADDFIATCYKHIEKVYGTEELGNIKTSLETTITSMEQHNSLDLTAKPSDIYENYYKRGASYILWPTSIIAKYAQNTEVKGKLYELSIAKHIGSQIMNDIRDMYLKKFNDIKNHQPTLPLLLLYKNSNEEEKMYLKSIFGKNITDVQIVEIDRIISSTNTLLKSQLLSMSVLDVCQKNITILEGDSQISLKQWLHKFYAEPISITAK